MALQKHMEMYTICKCKGQDSQSTLKEEQTNVNSSSYPSSDLPSNTEGGSWGGERAWGEEHGRGNED